MVQKQFIEDFEQASEEFDKLQVFRFYVFEELMEKGLFSRETELLTNGISSYIFKNLKTNNCLTAYSALGEAKTFIEGVK